MLLHCVVIIAALAVASSVTASVPPPPPSDAQQKSDAGSIIGRGLHYAFDVFRGCTNGDISTCLKLKLLSALDRADEALPEVALTDGVEFVRKPDAISNEIPKSESEIEASLPRALGAKDAVLNSLIADRISNFFSSHTLQVNLPSSSDFQRSFEEEGRKKKGSKGGYSNMVLVPMLLGGTLIPIALKGLVLLAGKALIISIIALVLGSAIGLKSLFGSSSSEPRTPQRPHPLGIDVPNALPYQRSLDNNDETVQNLAYSGYVPNYL